MTVERESTYFGLHRSRHACIAGVCAGIAERFNCDSIVVRILFVLLSLCTFGVFALVYVAMWLTLPVDEGLEAPYDVVPESAGSVSRGDDNTKVTFDARVLRKGGDRLPITLRLAIAVGLILLFMFVSFTAAPLVRGASWWQFWPVAFIIVGLCLIIIPVRTTRELAWHAIGVAVTSFAAFLLPMSIGLISWETLPNAFANLWPVLAAAVVFVTYGLRRFIDALVIGGALCVPLFCLVGLLFFSVSGDLSSLLILMPDGSAVRIALGS